MKLTDAQKSKVIERIQNETDIPKWIPGFVLNAVLKLALNQFLNWLEGRIPEELEQAIHSTAIGYANDDVEQIKNGFAERLNKAIDIPFIGESAERKLFDALIKVIFDATKLEKAL